MCICVFECNISTLCNKSFRSRCGCRKLIYSSVLQSITLNPFSQILHGRYWPRPCLWAAGMEWHVGGFGPFSEQLTALVLNSLHCLCGICISEYQFDVDAFLTYRFFSPTGGGRGFISVQRINICLCSLVHFLPFFHVTGLRLYVGHPLGHNNSNHTAELCRRLFPLNLKKSLNPIFSFRIQGLAF